MVLLYFLQHRCGTANITVCFSAPASALITLTQYGFITTGLACLAQALLGHRRAIMEGPTGLWWNTILTVTVGEAARGRRSTTSPPAGCRHIFLGGAHHHYWRKRHWPSPGEAVQPNGNGLFHAAAGRAADYHLLKACLGCPLVRRRLIRVFSWRHFARRCR